MKIPLAARKLGRVIRSRLRTAFGLDPNSYLKKCHSLLHIGANNGYERELYEGYGLNVLWVEANPSIFAELTANLSAYPRQRAVQALVTDRDGQEHDFHVSNNAGLSSSIFELKDHRKLWPEVEFTSTVRLRSSTLETVVRQAGMMEVRFDALVLDVQGAEHLVINGAGSVLNHVTFVKLEASDFEAYAGAATLESVTRLMGAHGFEVVRRDVFKRKAGVGAYYDALFRRKT